MPTTTMNLPAFAGSLYSISMSGASQVRVAARDRAPSRVIDVPCPSG